MEMINFVFWNKTGHSDNRSESVRFIVKNIQPDDVLIFNDMKHWCSSSSDLMHNIDNQCGTGLDSELTYVEKSKITKSLYTAENFDMEELHSRKHIQNLVLLGFDDYPPQLLSAMICNFATKTEILGITDISDHLLSGVLSRVKILKQGGMSRDQTRITMILEDKYHNKMIDQALLSAYTSSEYNVTHIQSLDMISHLWSNGISKK